MAHLVFLKLGGSAITDKATEATPRLEVIRDAAQEVSRALTKNSDLQVLLGQGSGSFGHFTASKTGFFDQGDNWRAYAETAAAANRLNRLVTDIFLEEGVPVVSFQPSASALCRDGELVSFATDPIRAAFNHKLVPVVYGDVSLDEKRGKTIASTEMIFSYLAPIFVPKRIVYVTAVNGIYAGDPTVNPKAELIPEITPDSFAEIEAGVGAASGVDVTGGMMDKARRALDLVKKIHHLEVYVIGTEPGLIERALLQDNFAEGTWIHAGAISGD